MPLVIPGSAGYTSYFLIYFKYRVFIKVMAGLKASTKEKLVREKKKSVLFY